MSIDTVLKFAALGVVVAVGLQVVFFFIFQVIGYNSCLLSITLIISVIIGFSLLAGWRIPKRVL